jgi:hypothetical protein
MSDAAMITKGFRQVIQDPLVPELRSIKTEIEYMKKAIDSNTEEIKSLNIRMSEFGGQLKELKEITLRLVDKFDASLKYAELSERLARLEEKINQ